MTIEALTAQEENAEADKLIGSLQNGGGGVVNTRMCYMCFDDVDEAGNPLVSTKFVPTVVWMYQKESCRLVDASEMTGNCTPAKVHAVSSRTRMRAHRNTFYCISPDFSFLCSGNFRSP